MVMRYNVFLYEFLPSNMQDFFRVFFLLSLITFSNSGLVNLIFINMNQMYFINKCYKKRRTYPATLVFRMPFNFNFFFGDIFLYTQSVFLNVHCRQFDFFKKIIHSLLHSSKFDHSCSKTLTFVLNVEFLYLNFLLKFF